MSSQPLIVSDTVAAWLHMPLVDLDKHVEIQKAKGPGREWFPNAENRLSLQECVKELDGLIEKAARVREYLDQRDGAGCGDQGHADAVKASNKLAAKIRKALGFTFARQDVRF